MEIKNTFPKNIQKKKAKNKTKTKILTRWHDSLSKSDSKAVTYNDGGKLFLWGYFLQNYIQYIIFCLC